MEDEKPHRFKTDAEFTAYQLGQADHEESLIKYIEGWEGEIDSKLGIMINDKFRERMEEEIRSSYVHGQGNAEMMEAGLERNEIEDYVLSRMRQLDFKK
jgi:hypothetical protein